MNPPATGGPVITGSLRAGETLTADTSGIADENGLTDPQFRYQWVRMNPVTAAKADIDGETDSRYVVTDDDEDMAILVRVVFIDDLGYEETLDSHAVLVSVPNQEAVNTPATGAPGIAGTPWVGETLFADISGIEDEDGLSNDEVTYQWVRHDFAAETATEADEDIDDQTEETYVVTDDDVGKALRVRVSFTDDAGNEESLTSAATTAVRLPLTAEFLDAPTGHDGSAAFTFEVRYSEPFPLAWRTMLEDTITVTNGTITEARRLDNPHHEADGIQPNREWRITVEPGGNGDVVIVLPITTDCDAQGAVCTADGRMLSNRTEITVNGNTPATGQPGIDGIPEVGLELTADTSDISDADGLVNATFGYRWLADDAPIADATGDRYTVSATDERKAIKVRVSFSDDAGNEESLTSAATAAVTRPPLTAEFRSAPAEHDGSAAFTFELRFSEAPVDDFSYKTLRDHAFTVTGGEVTVASRQERPGNIRWEIHVRPNSNGTVTIVLPATTDCNAQGAICTEDGRKLSNRLELTVSGPGG